jgi:hypothetical protein
MIPSRRRHWRFRIDIHLTPLEMDCSHMMKHMDTLKRRERERERENHSSFNQINEDNTHSKKNLENEENKGCHWDERKSNFQRSL